MGVRKQGFDIDIDLIIHLKVFLEPHGAATQRTVSFIVTAVGNQTQATSISSINFYCLRLVNHLSDF
jgi:hypothetical protein